MSVPLLAIQRIEHDGQTKEENAQILYISWTNVAPHIIGTRYLHNLGLMLHNETVPTSTQKHMRRMEKAANFTYFVI